MKKPIVALMCALFLSVSLGGCYTATHTIGNGGSGASKVSARQWYALWGLVPINKADGGKLVAGAADYTIKSQITPVDWVISIVTSWVTVYSQTVTVSK